MIIIGKKSFNMDMDIYLSKRGTEYEKPEKKGRKKKEKVEVVEVEEMAEEQPRKKESVLKKILDAIFGKDPAEEQKELEEYEDEEAEKEVEVVRTEETTVVVEEKKKKKKGFFDRLFAWLDASEDYEDDFEEGSVDQEELIKIDDEIKEALKIQNKWMKKLPADRIKEFKESGDYEKYRNILEKHGLIRKE